MRPDQLAGRHAVALDASRGGEPGCAFIQDESRAFCEETADRGVPAAQGATKRPCVKTHCTEASRLFHIIRWWEERVLC